MGFSNYLIGRIQDRTFGALPWTPPATLYIALFTVLPDDDNVGGTEVTGGDYVRAALTNGNSQLPDSVLGTGLKFNASAITFITPTAAWGDVVGIGIYDLAIAVLGQTFTVPDHTNDFINCVAHGYSNGDVIRVSTTVTLPTNLTAATDYYVRDKTADTFKVALTPGGAAVDIGSAGSGTHSVYRAEKLLAVAPIATRTVASGVPFTIPAAALRLTLTGYSHYLNKAILDYVFGNQAFTVPSLFCSLFSAAPDNYGVGGTECAGTSYARDQVTNNATEFPNSSGGLKSNANAITFAAAGAADWEDIVAEGIHDSLTGGNLLLVQTIGTTAVANGAAWVIPAGSLRLTMT